MPFGLFSKKKDDNKKEDEKKADTSADPAVEQKAPVVTATSASAQQQQPQWGADAATATSTSTSQILTQAELKERCSRCCYPKKKCACERCARCKKEFPILGRKHCHVCHDPVCGSCRSRVRLLTFVPPLKGVAKGDPACDRCALPTGVPRVPSLPTEHFGLTLLKAATDMPHHCVDVDRCGRETYNKALGSCAACAMPIVSTAPKDFKLIRHTYNCCSYAARCPRCCQSERNMALLEESNRARKLREFESMTPADVTRAVHRSLGIPYDPSSSSSAVDGDTSSLAGVFDGASGRTMEEIAVAAYCTLVCYEYEAYPHTMMRLSDEPIASVLLLRESHQLWSLFELPNKTVVLAFPGTHDLRTTVTDIKFGRVRHNEWGSVHGGVTSDGGSVSGGRTLLWSYKVHEGFYAEAQKLVRNVPTRLAASYAKRGYRVVFTGHSLGGALAALTTIRHLSDDLATFRDKVTCVTLGAPLIGSGSLSAKIERCGWTKYFHHLVFRGDIVPRLLVIRQLPREAYYNVQAKLKDGAGKLADVVKGFFAAKKDQPGGAASTKQTTEGKEAVASCVAAAAALNDDDSNGIDLDDDEMLPPPPASSSAAAFAGGPPSLQDPGDEAPLTTTASSASLGSSVKQQVSTVPHTPKTLPPQGPSANALRAQDKIARLPFDCYGRYHFLIRGPTVPYKSTASRSEAFAALRSGDGAGASVDDHHLDLYALALTRAAMSQAQQRQRTNEDA